MITFTRFLELAMEFSFIIFGVFILIVLIVLIIFSVNRIKKMNYQNIHDNREQRCLSVYNNYFQMDQEPIPNGGKYFNQFFKKNKYYGLRDFYYASSYKSYLPCGSTNDIVSYNAIKNVLLNGARVINLDLFYKGFIPFADDAEVIVGNVINGKLSYLPDSPVSQQYLNFSNCLQIISELGWKKTEAPLFLYLNLEFEANQKLEYQIFSQIQSKLSKRLMDKYYGFQRVNIGDIPVNKATNRLIILTNRKPVNGFLNEITNGVMATTSVNLILYVISDKDIEYGGIKTKFPNQDGAKEITQFNLTAVIKTNEVNENNIVSPKIDTSNYDTSENFAIGISMTFMNWQNFPDEDDNMKKYLENFKSGGMVLKPASLIYEPRPLPPALQRDKQLDYVNRNVSGLNDFYNFDV